VLYQFIGKLVVVFIVFSFAAQAKEVNHACLLYLMPCPQSVTIDNGHYVFKPQLDIYIEGMSKKRQQAALARTQQQLMRLTTLNFSHFNVVHSAAEADIVIVVHAKTLNPKTSEIAYILPVLGNDERYQLHIQPTLISIEANTDFGAMHALTTVVQLVSGADKDLAKAGLKSPLQALHLPQLRIIDSPRFAWRGLLIDSVRHFIPLNDLKRQLDGLAAAKLNVFHWHLTDDQGWRIESKRYPKLHQMASDNIYYTQQEIKELVAYASVLGIRVVPEFDVPGHASAIAVAYPELMAEKKHYTMERQWGVFEPVLDVSDAKVYAFIDGLVGEIAALFPDSYIHIGGDEVNPKQWLNNDNIIQLMRHEKLKTSYDLHHYFNLKVQAILSKYDRKMMAWDEIYHPDLPRDVVIQSWRGLASLHMFAKRGYQGVLSTGFYIDQPQYSAYHYRNDPITISPFYTSIPADTHAANMAFDKSEQHRMWQLTIPRLKGADVSATFILAAKMRGSHTQGLRGFLKLNNNAYQKVTILTPATILNAPQKTNESLTFAVDSWMGPLRFEIQITAPATSSKASENKRPSTPINRVFIGNAFYPLLVQEQNQAALPNLALEKRLSADQSSKILGAEATLWSEMVTQDNIDLRTWPRLFVIAERLWSSPALSDVDNMYQRLFFMDSYSENIIGLMHKQQKLRGFAHFLGSANTQQNMDALLRLAEVIEPAHYYTRHHIKYQQNKYHQLAPLDSFVDFLPVESYTLITLDNLIRAYQHGDTSVLLSIKGKVQAWQENEKQLRRYVLKDTKFFAIVALIDDVSTFNQVAMNIVQACMSETPFPENTRAQLSQKLNQLQNQQNEIVLAAIPLFQQLLASCHHTNKQVVHN
jgi:hexosaminidase